MTDHPEIEQPREIEDGTREVKRPLVSVVMPLYRENPYYEQAISSILSQTCSSLELIVICDDPTGEARSRLEEIGSRDDRVVLRFNTPGIGLVASRNLGIQLARGTYVNPMDSDDFSHPERLERQVASLERNPDTGLLGTGIEYVDGQGTVIRKVEPIARPKALKWALFFENPICQSSVLIRRQILDQVGWYDECRPLAEDYDLWIRIASVAGLQMLPEILMQYRIHESNISSHGKAELDRKSSELNSALVSGYFHELGSDEIAVFQHLFLRRDLSSESDAMRMKRTIETMYQAFLHRERPTRLEREEIEKHLGLQYLILAYLSRNASRRQALGFLISGFHHRRSLPCDLLRMVVRKAGE